MYEELSYLFACRSIRREELVVKVAVMSMQASVAAAAPDVIAG
jgi:hypothetical protein